MVATPLTTYATLGSTGNCGTAIIQQLLQKPNVAVNAYCRNKRKLYALIPGVADSKKVEVFEGNIQDIDLLARCIDGCRAVFLLASTNDNVPGIHVSQDLATNIVAALKKLKAVHGTDFTAPKLVLLSSATVDDHLSRHMGFFRHIMLRAASNVYEDLRRAERYLRTQEDWLKTIYIKPGGLSVDIQRGHRLTLDEEETFISYQDLAAGMLEAVNDPTDRWDFLNVGVVNSNRKAKFARGTPMCIILGLIRYYLPFMHPYLPPSGPV